VSEPSSKRAIPAITFVILTRDEAIHIERAIASAAPVSRHVLVVDSGSTDGTIELARNAGAEVLQNRWINYATQFNWALENLPSDTEWVFRLDADEFLTDRLCGEIAEKLAEVAQTAAGINISRYMNFCRGKVRFGGLFPVRVTRLFRPGKGRCENRWMDEHIVIDGPTIDFSGEIVDDNLKPLSWWIDKHNAYASREVVDLLNREFGFMESDPGTSLQEGSQARKKRWIKDHLYSRMPGGLRALAYFLYRFVIRLGFLDTREGRMFHVLQGFWYRYLVDAKMHEVKAYMDEHQTDVVSAIGAVLKIDVGSGRP